MRDALQNLTKLSASHPALAYQCHAEIQAGKIPDAHRVPWLERIARFRAPEGYAAALRTWQCGLDRGPRCVVRTQSRMLIGAGDTSLSDIGLRMHHTWGVPYIPGSAIKGLLASFVDRELAADFDARNAAAQLTTFESESEADRHKLRGPNFHEKSIRHGPGAWYRALFGAPEADSDRQVRRELGVDASQVGATQGQVVFHDAMFLPESCDAKRGGREAPFGIDTLTVHQKEYYNSAGASEAKDWDEPNPVSFLTVEPGTHFMLALGGDADWARLAFELLTDEEQGALAESEVGSKTSLGYGRLGIGKRLVAEVRDDSLDDLRQTLAAAEAELSAITDAELAVAWFRERLAAWAPRLKGMDSLAREAAYQVFQSAKAKLGVSKKKRKAITELITTHQSRTGDDS